MYAYALGHYYDGELPVSLEKWAKKFQPGESLIYRGMAVQQVDFVKWMVRDLFLREQEHKGERIETNVISTHISKSVVLPVYQILCKGGGNETEIIMRGNFYDWKVSVSTKGNKFIKEDWIHLFRLTDLEEKVSRSCCEGFPSDKIYGSFDDNPGQFTVEIFNDYKLYAFMLVVKAKFGDDY
ncbi:hypothetical protein IKW75_01585 [Candidatus Saccharibacteria bacterium]|nr:hypothetical protein [Candidatus Saccharibacteria bacterium]